MCFQTGVTSLGEYREGKEYSHIKDYLLGNGTLAGGISVAVDNKTLTKHAVKKVLFSL